MCEALGWAARNRALTVTQTVRAPEGDGVEKTSAILPGRLSGAVRDLEEAFQILSIFRSNSFNLGSSAALPWDVHPPSPSPSTGSDDALQKANRSTTPDLETTPPSTRPAYQLALFPAIARINHSCNPNAQANYHALHQTFNVHATRDIPAGDEVSINYLPEHGQLRDQRVSKLEDGYGFTCNCAACDLATDAGQQGEQSRKEMQASMKKTKALFTDGSGVAETAAAGYGADGMPETLASAVSDEEQQQITALKLMPEEERQTWLRDRELEVLNTMLAMYQAEGIAGREVASMYYHIARLQRRTGSGEDAVASAEAGLQLDEACLGTDHPAYLEAVALVEDMREDAAGAQPASMQSV
jgi:hypothetical protein